MSCRECRTQLVAYLNKTLPAREQAAVTQHLEDCEHCRGQFAREQAIRQALQQEAPIPAPTAGFEQRVLSAATHGRHRGFSVSLWVGAAVAAALVLGVVLGAGLFSGASREPSVAVQPVPSDPVKPLSEDILQTVRLAFSSHSALDNVMLTLELPQNVELAKFPGRQRLSWKVDLKAGENVLSLPIRVLFPGQGELVAHLESGAGQKTFRVRLPGTDSSGGPSS